MTNCKCCGKCRCNKFIESVGFEFLDKKISIPVNKTIAQLKCYEYWYLGDATSYYTYDDNGNPIKNSYKNQKFKITFNNKVDKFKLDPSNFVGILKYCKFSQTGNTIYIETPDERLFSLVQVVLSYKNFKLYFALDEFEILKNFKSSGIPELQDLTVEDLSEELPSRQPLQEFVNSGNVDAYFEIDGGSGGYTNLLGGPYTKCADVSPLRVDAGTAYVETRYTGFLIIFYYTDRLTSWNILPNQDQIKFFPTYYSTYRYDRNGKRIKHTLYVKRKTSGKCSPFEPF